MNKFKNEWNVPQLHELYSGKNVNSYVIIVPGLTCQQPEEWNSGPKKAWLNTLTAAGASRCQFLLYDHRLVSNAFSWPELFNCGKELVHALILLQKGVLHYPIVFICHSLGGIIVKQALWHARQQDNYRRLEELTSGLIFLGTPHSTREDDPRWKQLISVLKPGAKNLSRWAPTPEDLNTLARISFQFEEIDSIFPILSVYETLGTKVQEHRLRRSKETLLVGKDFSLTCAKHLERLEIETDYHNLCLCQFDEHRTRVRKMSNFIRLILKDSDCRMSIEIHAETMSTSPPFSSVRRSNKSLSTSSLEIATTVRARTPDISMRADYTMSRKGPRLPCHNFKSHLRNVRFFGRTDVLERLKEALVPNDSYQAGNDGPRTFALCGLGGVGKTEIAVEFMFLQQKKFDAIFWLQADGLSKLMEEFGQIAAALGLEDVDDAFDQDVSRNLAKRWLTNPTKIQEVEGDTSIVPATWLIIFDNVEDPDILKEFWPTSGNGSIIITSRDPFAKNQGFTAAASGEDVKEFDFDGAARFLIKLTSHGEEEDQQLHKEATKIAKRLGGLPLAITQMAGIINRRALSLAEFLDQVQEGKFEEFHSLQLGPQMRDYKHSLATVWAFEQLQAGPLALLDVISLLDPGPIGEEILRRGGGKVKLKGYPRTPDEYLDARSALIHSSLITKNSKSAALLVHRLTQDVARFRMNVTRFHAVFEAAVVLISEVWRPEPLHKRYETTRWREHEAILPHIRGLRNLYVKSKSEFVASLAFAKLLNNVAWYFHQRGKSEDHELFAPLSQHIVESQSPQNREVRLLLAAIHYCRGSEASESNQPESCLRHFKAHLALRQNFCDETGKPDEDLASAYNELGVAYMMNKMYVEGMHAFEKSIEIYQGLEDYSGAMTAFPCTNLGLSYWLQGQHKMAEQMLLDALHDREAWFGEMDKESLKTGRILQALGNLYESQDKLDESFEFHTRALEQFRSTVGHSHHRTADVCHKLAGHYIRLREYEKARKLLEQALRIYNGRAQLKQEKARTSFKMGKLLQVTGDEEAAAHLQEAWSIYHALIPNDGCTLEDLTDVDFDSLVSFWT